MRRIDPRLAGSLALLVSLAACVAPPMAPTIPVAPGPGRTGAAFASDQAYCQQYAYSQTAPQAAAANNQAVGSTLLSTALGAGLGAAIGGGRGAAIGAASGAAFGTVANASSAGWAQMSLQQQFDSLFASCMAGHGDRVPGFSAPPGMPPYAGPGYGPAPYPYRPY